MEYSNLSHEARELLLFIENNAEYYKLTNFAETKKQLRTEIDSACIQYKIDNCTSVQDEIFSEQDRKQVVEYIQDKKRQSFEYFTK